MPSVLHHTSRRRRQAEPITVVPLLQVRADGSPPGWIATRGHHYGVARRVSVLDAMQLGKAANVLEATRLVVAALRPCEGAELRAELIEAEEVALNAVKRELSGIRDHIAEVAALLPPERTPDLLAELNESIVLVADRVEQERGR